MNNKPYLLAVTFAIAFHHLFDYDVISRYYSRKSNGHHFTRFHRIVI
jgi:hypothetical protein